jgi:type-F conjugative transfer system pilin assembly protein TrbC
MRSRNILCAAAMCTASVFSSAQVPPPPADLGQFKDLEQMARQFTGGASVSGESSSGVMLFVSLSMPPAVLRELADQAADAGIAMVLRGFAKAPGQIEAVNPTLTTERINALLTTGLTGSTKSPSWAVDPEAFRTFGINRVPALVVAHQRLPGSSCAKDAMLGEKGAKLGQSCASEWEAAVVYGDTSLHESLRRA